MDLKAEILDIPHALGETLEKGRPEYDAVVRQTRWGDGPVYIVGSGSSLVAGLSAAYAFESLLGWPAIVREAAAFQACSLSVLRPRSVVLAISPSGEDSETLEMAQVARSRRATVLVLTNNAQSALAKSADGVFLVRAGEEQGAGAKAAVCQQAAASYLGLVAARVLKRPHPQLDALEADFEKLPGHVEWALTQLTDAVRSFAAELQGLQSLCAVGGGFYHPAALQWASLVKKLTAIDARGLRPWNSCTAGSIAWNAARPSSSFPARVVAPRSMFIGWPRERKRRGQKFSRSPTATTANWRIARPSLCCCRS